MCFCYYSWVSLSFFLTLGSLVPSNLFEASELSQFMGSLAERRTTLAVFGQALWVFLDTQLSKIVLHVLSRTSWSNFSSMFYSPHPPPRFFFFQFYFFRRRKVVKLCFASSALLLVLFHLVKCWTIDDCDQGLEKVLNH